MRINENTLLEGEKVVLVPYNAYHVPRYHEWMKSPELQQLTASEPLSLDQEYEMQRSWREDNDKCTFIILDKQLWSDPMVQEEQCMVGDVNIFLTDPNDFSLAELEIMIAEPSYRGKGLGKEVTCMMMCYVKNYPKGMSKLGIQKFEAKIGLDNTVSIAMFKKFHFRELSVCKVFKEVTLGMTVDHSIRTKLLGDMAYVKERQSSLAMVDQSCTSCLTTTSCLRTQESPSSRAVLTGTHAISLRRSVSWQAATAPAHPSSNRRRSLKSRPITERRGFGADSTAAFFSAETNKLCFKPEDPIKTRHVILPAACPILFFFSSFFFLWCSWAAKASIWAWYSFLLLSFSSAFSRFRTSRSFASRSLCLASFFFSCSKWG
ncbi:N-acetyltransferase 9 [Merluccius polli]|uniref:Alpha/beta-tubulin-N-acetyltransferase 9 n=1 Tax=Merluccius polli TaxID=89951 RepID=A0AA47M682_MERPO|nr:N-acetyltransferase 9 [Merluccius polli]